jgi:hypothetical protein
VAALGGGDGGGDDGDGLGSDDGGTFGFDSTVEHFASGAPMVHVRPWLM